MEAASSQLMNATLDETYYDPGHPAGYAGARNLVRAAGRRESRTAVRRWLAAQDAYTLHKPVRRKFPRGRYEVSNIDDLWEADLADLSSSKGRNNGYRYLLTVIDVLSKYAWVIPLKRKTAAAVAEGFQKVLSSTPRRPTLLQTDKGKEFLGSVFQKLLTENGIRYRYTRNPDIKAAIVERFNRTLKERLWRYFTHKKTRRYVDILPQIVKAYNTTVHSSIGMPPSTVTLENAAEARAHMLKRYPPRPVGKPRYREGDIVRISRTKGTFEKGYVANWSEEMFTIRRVLARRPIVYILEDEQGEVIDGAFYEAELQRIERKDTTAVHRFDKIVRPVEASSVRSRTPTDVVDPDKTAWTP